MNLNLNLAKLVLPITDYLFTREQAWSIFLSYLPRGSLYSALQYQDSNARRFFEPIILVLQETLKMMQAHTLELDPINANIFLPEYEDVLKLPSPIINFGTDVAGRQMAVIFALRSSLTFISPQNYLELLTALGFEYVRGYYISNDAQVRKIGWDFTEQNYFANSNLEHWTFGSEVLPVLKTQGVNIAPYWIGGRSGATLGQVNTRFIDDEHGYALRAQRVQGDIIAQGVSVANIMDTRAVQMIAGKNVTFSAYVKMSPNITDTNGRINVVARATQRPNQTVYTTPLLPYWFKDYDEQQIAAVVGNVQTTTDKGIWQRVSINVNMPSDAGSALLQFESAHSTTPAPSDDFYEVTKVQCSLGSDVIDFYQTEFKHNIKPYATTATTDTNIVLQSQADYDNGYIIEVPTGNDANTQGIVAVFNALRLMGVKIKIIEV